MRKSGVYTPDFLNHKVCGRHIEDGQFFNDILRNGERHGSSLLSVSLIHLNKLVAKMRFAEALRQRLSERNEMRDPTRTCSFCQQDEVFVFSVGKEQKKNCRLAAFLFSDLIHKTGTESVKWVYPQ